MYDIYMYVIYDMWLLKICIAYLKLLREEIFKKIFVTNIWCQC